MIELQKKLKIKNMKIEEKKNERALNNESVAVEEPEEQEEQEEQEDYV